MSGERTYDYIVIGSGAGGAVVAARLAEQGMDVLVIEAGDDPLSGNSDDAAEDMPLSAAYRVPAFHAFASEHPGMTQRFWVRHYAKKSMQQRDWRYSREHDGVLYPRVRGLGGCTAHHAMIVVKPNACDWNHIRQVTGDDSWRASHMQRYFERIERCRYRFFLWRWLAALTGLNPTGHGWWGWMTTERAFPLRPIRDWLLWRALLHCIGAAADAFGGPGTEWETTAVDPNDHRNWNQNSCGVRLTPMSTRRHVRHGPREWLLEVRKRHPERLEIRLNTTVTRIGFEGRRASAVHCVSGDGAEFVITARREIIVAAGAFVTPQLLMLSGIGEPRQLQSLGLPVVEALPGVGRNLQDRYEIGVVNRLKQPWSILKDVSYSVRDAEYRRWNSKWWRRGNYTSNGVMFSLSLKSRPTLTEPDLHCFSLLADFRGYYQSYAERIRDKNYMSWVVLKAYTQNQGGTVRLKSADWRIAPEIQFHSFHEGSGDYQLDLDAMVTGIRFVRKVTDAMDDMVDQEEEPGWQRDSDDALKQYVAENAWGHHACGTCAIGPREAGGVLDSRFRVHGVEGLRVVDASVFPRIPGYFLASAVYMIAEKAADDILADA